MGKYNAGILGSFRGQIGSVIGSFWRGISYMRIMPQTYNDAASPEQVMQRAMFTLILRRLQIITAFIRETFTAVAIEMTEFNAAMSYNILNAITGDYPDMEIDPAEFRVSAGTLTAVPEATATAAGTGKITVAWEDNTGIGSAKGDDNAQILAICAALKTYAALETEAARADGTATLTAPDSFVGESVDVYLVFSDKDKNTYANSVYAGTITIT